VLTFVIGNGNTNKHETRATTRQTPSSKLISSARSTKSDSNTPSTINYQSHEGHEALMVWRDSGPPKPATRVWLFGTGSHLWGYLAFAALVVVVVLEWIVKSRELRLRARRRSRCQAVEPRAKHVSASGTTLSSVITSADTRGFS